MITKYASQIIRSFNAALATTAQGEVSGSVPFIEVAGVAIYPLKIPQVTPTAFGAAVAAAAYLNIYTVTAGLRPFIKRITVSASVAARYSIEYNGVVIWSNHLAALTAHEILWGEFGTFKNTVAGLFRIQNNGAGAADIAVSMVIDER